MLNESNCQFMVISTSAHIIAIRRIAKKVAENIGFDSKTCEQIVLVVSELASNIIKYAGRGVITLTPVIADNRQGIMIESVDDGPGFEEDFVLADGVSTQSTLGYGLGTVNRMMDEFDIQSEAGSSTGTRILCKRWLPEQSINALSCPFEFAVVSRPKPGEMMNGDAFVIKHGVDNSTLIAVIDGVGHGALAHEASKAAKNYIEAHSHLPITDIFKGTERACRATRGVVMAIAIFDWESMRLTYGSVGNIEVRVLGNHEKFKFIVRRGIVGKKASNPVITCNDWYADSILVLHSDGLTSRWSSNDFISYHNQPAKTMTEHMLRTLAKDHDDATLVIVK